MNSLIEEIFKVYKEKTRLPIISTYLFILIFWNWDIWSIYLFSDLSIEDRITSIKNINDCRLGYFFRIVIPLFMAFLYPLISNYLMLKIDKILEKSREKRVNIIYDKKILIARKQLEVEKAKNDEGDLKESRTLNDSLRKEKEILVNQMQSQQKIVERVKELETNNEELTLIKDFKKKAGFDPTILYRFKKDNDAINSISIKYERFRESDSMYANDKFLQAIMELKNNEELFDIYLALGMFQNSVEWTIPSIPKDFIIDTELIALDLDNQKEYYLTKNGEYIYYFLRTELENYLKTKV